MSNNRSSMQAILWALFVMSISFLVFSMLCASDLILKPAAAASGATSEGSWSLIVITARLFKVLVFFVIQVLLAKKIEEAPVKFITIGAVVSAVSVPLMLTLSSTAAGADVIQLIALILTAGLIEATGEACMVTGALVYVRLRYQKDGSYMRNTIWIRLGQNSGYLLAIILGLFASSLTAYSETGRAIPYFMALGGLRLFLLLAVLVWVRSRPSLLLKQTADEQEQPDGGKKPESKQDPDAEEPQDYPKGWDPILGALSYGMFYVMVFSAMTLDNLKLWEAIVGLPELVGKGGLLGNTLCAVLAMVGLLKLFDWVSGEQQGREARIRAKRAGRIEWLQGGAVIGMTMMSVLWVAGVALQENWWSGLLVVVAATFYGLFSTANYVLSELLSGVLPRFNKGKRLSKFYGYSKLGAIAGIVITALAGLMMKQQFILGAQLVIIAPVVIGISGSIWALVSRNKILKPYLASL